MSELIRIEGVSKRYRLGTINRGMLYKDLQSWWARKRGKDDPHAKLVDSHKRIENGDEFWALRDISLSINAGDTLAIIGRNGAGKSTLLKILSRITSPTKGQVKTRGRICSLLEVGTGFHGELTGRENVFLNGAILGMSRKEIQTRFDEIIDFAEIADFVDTPVKRYSSGMFVRLAFAVAAHLDPEVLIVDEVLAVGDIRFQKKCLGKMADASEKEGRTVIFVSHNMAAIQRLCSRAAVIDHGRLIHDGQLGESILKYLHLSGSISESIASRRFSADHMAPGSCIIVESVSITNSADEETVEFTIEDPFSITMRYRIESSSQQRHVPTYQFNTSEGTCAFVSTAPNVSILKPGNYQAKLQIPGNLLNSGGYSIDIAILSYDMEKGTYTTVLHERGALSIVISEPENCPTRYSFAGHIPGVIRPELPWAIVQTD